MISNSISYFYFRALLVALLLVLFGHNVLAKGSSKPKTPSKPVVAERFLKKAIHLDHYRAMKIVVDNLFFDYENAVNQQLITAVLETSKFTLKVPNTSNASTIRIGSGGVIELVESDMPEFSDVDDRCLARLPQMVVDGEVLGLELESKTGVELQLAPFPNIPLSGGLNFSAKTFRLSTVTHARDPSGRTVLGSVLVNEEQKEKNSGFNINFADLVSFGVSHYKKTPLSTVTDKNLRNSVNKLYKQTQHIEWESPVVIADGSFVGLNVGADAGVKVGDEFKVHNVNHYWSGLPCRSSYSGSRPEVDEVAVIRVYDVSSTSSWASVVEWRNPEGAIWPGARVRILELPPM